MGSFNAVVEVHNRGGDRQALRDTLATVFAHNSELNRFSPYRDEIPRTERVAYEDTGKVAVRIGEQVRATSDRMDL